MESCHLLPGKHEETEMNCGLNKFNGFRLLNQCSFLGFRFKTSPLLNACLICASNPEAQTSTVSLSSGPRPQHFHMLSLEKERLPPCQLPNSNRFISARDQLQLYIFICLGSVCQSFPGAQSNPSLIIGNIVKFNRGGPT